MPKFLSYFIVACFLITATNSCSDDDKTSDRELELSTDNASIKLTERFLIAVTSGNGGYSILSHDVDIVTGEVDVENENRIILTARGKGETKVTIKDRSQKEIMVSVKVVNRYLAFVPTYYSVEVEAKDAASQKTIEEDILENPFPPKSYAYKLEDSDKKEMTIRSSVGSIKVEGTYAFSNDGKTNNLKLKYDDKEFSYVLSDEYEGKYFYNYFNKEEEEKSQKEISQSKYIELTEDLTEVYKEKYPDAEVESVKFIIIATIIEKASSLE
ncbi:hypothetical protein [Prevotella sp. 10(H)]|uniref:hypothetical protein n=1 Tax=Prevotella sp. 10(H) TaxID=1158294 RepID=UPI0004A6CCE7|nr:hypothetical protein [Prevotella sp. 10(H)]